MSSSPRPDVGTLQRTSTQTSPEFSGSTTPPDSYWKRPSIREHGITEVYAGDVPDLDIVFIHGLQGHAEATWTYTGHRTSQSQQPREPRGWLSRFGEGHRSRSSSPHSTIQASCFWPADLLPRDIPRARILTYGYDANVSHFFGECANQNSITAHSESLLNALARWRTKCTQRPLLFVVHSLGGIILKSALRQSLGEEDEDLHSIYVSTFAIMFFGTPHRGSSFADLGKTIAHIAMAVGFDLSTDLLRNLQRSSEILDILRRDFVKMLDAGAFRVTTFQEAKPFRNIRGLAEKIVGDESSSLDHACERRDHINSNHLDMCKFKGPEDGEYEKARYEILRHISRFMHKTRAVRPSKSPLPDDMPPS